MPMRIVSWRRRTSTVSSATSRCPRTIRSSAHSLLPMPLSPAMSTPRPSTSISTACRMVRSASESSRIDDSFAIAVGVATAVLSSGSRARSASRTSSTGGAKPPVMRTQGKSSVSASRIAEMRAAASRLSRYRISLSPKIRTRPALRYSWKPASARPVFWMWGLVMTRSRPSTPARISSGRPNASGRLRSSPPTVTPGCDTSRFRLDQRQLAVAAVEDADGRGLHVAEDDHAFGYAADLARRFGQRHRLQPAPRGAQDARHPCPLAPDPSRRLGRDGGRFALEAGDGDGLAAATALALLPLAFDLVRLLRDLVDRDAQRLLPAPGIPDAVQELLAAGVQRDVGAVPVLLARQHRVRRDGAVVQRPLELRELGVDETAKRGSDVHMAAGQFESHTVPLGRSRRALASASSLNLISREPSVDSRSESSALRGTSRLCAARAPAPRAAGC